MATHTQRDINSCAYFVTFTCHNWLPLIEEATAHKAFENWFSYLPSKKVKLLGYVIMPNHFHCLLYFEPESTISLNALIANAKRFLAYDIIKGLEANNENERLIELFNSTTKGEKERGKKHKVFKTSFDSKIIESRESAISVLKYIHNNPNSKKWNLCDKPEEYAYSSCAFYWQNNANNDSLITDFRNFF
jgi:putative transposase